MSAKVMEIEQLSAERARLILPQLIVLLQDTVNSGASVGFIPPLTAAIAEQYWLETLAELTPGRRLLLVAKDGGVVTGSAQLALVNKQNGLHRAEVQKLIVHSSFRRLGIAQALMTAVEKTARNMGRTLLVLDTEQGSAAESLYAKWGYARAGVIPQYALDANGSLINTVVFYKLL